jgi:hypothetical protein
VALFKADQQFVLSDVGKLKHNNYEVIITDSFYRSITNVYNCLDMQFGMDTWDFQGPAVDPHPSFAKVICCSRCPPATFMIL